MIYIDDMHIYNNSSRRREREYDCEMIFSALIELMDISIK